MNRSHANKNKQYILTRLNTYADFKLTNDQSTRFKQIVPENLNSLTTFPWEEEKTLETLVTNNTLHFLPKRANENV